MEYNSQRNEAQNGQWYEEYIDEQEDNQIIEYGITSTPNDFNILTIFNFMESGMVKIPAFQRNYIWDKKRASKLIESIIIGLPIPQVFLYENAKNSFLVIDGQQRLMSIYYFMKQRFPKGEVRVELRKIFDEHSGIPEEILQDDHYFEKFNLKLSEYLPDKPNKFNKLNYETLGDDQEVFNMRTVRNIIIKQNYPDEDHSSMFEIFNRLNTGGINLKPQEIRTSLYHSKFYKMLYRINAHPIWRKYLNNPISDVHMKDIEFLLRGFAMLYHIDEYRPSMIRFLNHFSNFAKNFMEELIEYLENLFISFLDSCSELPADAFLSQNKKFSISIYDAVFSSVCKSFFESHDLVTFKISQEKLTHLKENMEFRSAYQSKTSTIANVKKRNNLARHILLN